MQAWRQIQIEASKESRGGVAELKGQIAECDVAFQLERYLPALATVATIAPLLGLFGTVIGMIEIFGAYRPDGSDPSELARGISIALYNTGFGILIAIPAVIAHRHFKSRVQALLVQMEQSARKVAASLREDQARS